MSLFKRLPGRSGENISTEILAYFLSSKERYIPFQKLIFNRILNVPSSSAQLQVETQTQATFKSGRPDLIILTEEAIIVLENKLGSYLSGDNQLISYCKVFEDISTLKDYFPFLDSRNVKKKILAFLAPRKIINLSISASDEACKKHQRKSFFDFIRLQNITFLRLPWEDVLGYLDLTDSLQYELFLFVKNFINQELSQEEKMILENPEIPLAIIKLFNRIDELRSHVSVNKMNVGRMAQSYNYYGFYIEAGNIRLFFGYFLPLWEKFNTPIFLQVLEDWIKENNKDNIKKLLKDNLFKFDEAHHWIRPFKIDSIESWKDELIKILRIIIGNIKS